MWECIQVIIGIWLAFALFGIPAGILKSRLDSYSRQYQIKELKK